MNFAKESGKEPNFREEKLPKINSNQNKSLSNCLEEIKLNLKKGNALAGISQQWALLVGKQLASNCTPLSLTRGILIIGASHPQWRQALIFTRNELLSSLRAAGYSIKDLKIQQYHPEKIKNLEPEKSIWAKHPSRLDVHKIETCQSCLKPATSGEISLWGKCGFCRRKDLNN